ncbi:MAG: site-specific integrase [Spirochaetaceae bacterium]|nr:site-specific integrase [Spirochaetaceae bacterium]MCF7948529.1 site-specific integrase [Spirochaetia bacterium]MCF7951007.1 site-specific integrase [Spirochaetaceae bacterium]
MSRFLPFHLIKRKNKKGKITYQARFINTETGAVICTRSTGQSNKTAAARVAEGMIADIEALYSGGQHSGKTTLSQYARDYFTPGGRYEQGRSERGHSVSNNYLLTCSSYTRSHIIPIFGELLLEELTPKVIDREIIKLFKSKKVMGGTVNRILRTLRLILEGAVQEELIEENYAAYVKPVKESRQERGVFTRKEIIKLFKTPDIWPDFRHYALNLLAFSTGMRLGEIRGLCIQNVYQNYVAVSTQWEDKVGLKAPKAGSIRNVALPAATAKALHMLIVETRPRDILFYSEGDRSKPFTKSHIEKTLYKVMEAAGIPPEERKTRNLVFHSWRHTLNTILRSEGISDAKVQKITGHRTDGMTENYTHFQADDFRDVSELTGRLLT